MTSDSTSNRSGPIILRPAKSRLDARNILAWRNDPTARQSALDSHDISWDEHWEWFNRKSADGATLLFIAELGGDPVGCVRVDRDGPTAVFGEVDILVAPGFRGQGLGTKMLAKLVAFCRQSTPLKTLTAKIKPENKASRAVFETNGFQHRGQRRVIGQMLDFFECPLR